MRVYIDEERHSLKIRNLLEAFFEDLILTDEEPDMTVNMKRLQHGDVLLSFTGEPLKEIYRYLETLRESRTEWGTLVGVRPLKQVHSRLDKGLTDADIKKHLTEELLLSERKTELLQEIAKQQRSIYLKDRDKLSVYLSIPFCPTICSYCNFHTRPYQKKLASQYMVELYRDLDLLKDLIRQYDRTVDVLYIGGGTPTSLSDESFEELMRKVEDTFSRQQIIEYTMEAGRLDSLSDKKKELLLQTDRVCINPQSLTTEVLSGVNRDLPEGFREAISWFEERGIIVNSDLIAGLPGETPESFQHSLEALIHYGPSNITIHDLSKKRGSGFSEEKLEDLHASEMLRLAYRTLKDQQYHPYYIYRQKQILANGENIGWEKADTPCIYNIRMMEDAHEILALGSSATSKFMKNGNLYRIQNVKELTLWINDPDRRRRAMIDFFERNKAGSN